MDTVTLSKEPYRIGLSGMDDIIQCMRTIILTTTYSIPLDRAFAHTADMVDAPAPHETARLTSILIDALEKYEPRIRVKGIELIEVEAAQGILMQGTLSPKITYTLAPGVTL